MNLFRFLKSTRGAIKPLNALLISGAVGVVSLYTFNNNADKQIEAERAVRTLSSIEGTAPEQGMRRQGDLLTSINVRDGRSQLATAEERAAIKGTSALDRYEANQRALGNMDAALTRAAQFSESDGLNTGNRNAVQSADRFVVGNPNAAAGSAVADSAYTRSGAQEGADGQSSTGNSSRLANASMAHASGNSFGGTSGAVSGGIATQGGPAEGPARLSGAMPGGSNIISQRASAGLGENRGTSSFGQNRNGRTTRGNRIGAERNELKDIVKKSAAAASNTRASANEGGRAFLASNNSSGGVQVDNGEDMTRGASSEDLAAPTNKKLKAVGDKLKEVEDKQAERSQAQKRLIGLLIGMTAASLAMMIAGATLLSWMDEHCTNPWGIMARWAIAAAMVAAVATFANILFVAAKHFIEDYSQYGGVGVATISKIVAPILLAGMTYIAIRPQDAKFFRKLGKNIINRFRKISVVDQAMSFIGGKMIGFLGI